MVIDYIYLILILILISSILYFIYLSYEYRQLDTDDIDNNNNNNNNNNNDNNNNNNNNNNIENFLDLRAFTLSNNTSKNADKQFESQLKAQQDIINDIFNRQVVSDNKSYSKLKEDSISNKNDSRILLTEKQLMEIVPQAFPIDKLIKTIKSNYNSQYLRLFANDINKYGVVVNDKCFTVNGLCKNDEFCLQQCQNNLYTSDSQKFYTDRINSDDDITRLMKIPKNKINSKNIYPFNIFRSKINDKCLSINNDGLGIENCNLNSIKQQWSISPDENICVLN